MFLSKFEVCVDCGVKRVNLASDPVLRWSVARGRRHKDISCWWRQKMEAECHPVAMGLSDEISNVHCRAAPSGIHGSRFEFQTMQ